MTQIAIPVFNQYLILIFENYFRFLVAYIGSQYYSDNSRFDLYNYYLFYFMLFLIFNLIIQIFN